MRYRPTRVQHAHLTPCFFSHLRDTARVHCLQVCPALQQHRCPQCSAALAAALLGQRGKALRDLHQGLELVQLQAGVSGCAGGKQLDPAALLQFAVEGASVRRLRMFFRLLFEGHRCVQKWRQKETPFSNILSRSGGWGLVVLRMWVCCCGGLGFATSVCAPCAERAESGAESAFHPGGATHTACEGGVWVLKSRI